VSRAKPFAQRLSRVRLFGPTLPKEQPTWWERASLYYSAIQNDRRDSVHVYRPPDDGQITPATPGTLRLKLEAAADELRVLDGDAHECGSIDVEWGKIKYAMRRDGCQSWKVAARSLMFRRYAVEFASGDRWLFYTPFFCWMGIAGLQDGQVRVLGWVGPNRQIWGLRVDPECDSVEVLALVALMHRSGWRPFG